MSLDANSIKSIVTSASLVMLFSAVWGWFTGSPMTYPMLLILMCMTWAIEIDYYRGTLKRTNDAKDGSPTKKLSAIERHQYLLFMVPPSLLLMLLDFYRGDFYFQQSIGWFIAIWILIGLSIGAFAMADWWRPRAKK